MIVSKELQPRTARISLLKGYLVQAGQLLSEQLYLQSWTRIEDSIARILMLRFILLMYCSNVCSTLI
nr:MAG TPA: hypothetical protein [Caudoviricetes sp.]